MTSVERVGQNSYPVSPGSNEFIERPKYAVLSYTWGRYERKPSNASHPRLKIDGLDWEIPAIDSSHFTVENFQDVLDSIRTESRRLSTLNKLGGSTLPAIECDFVWLDVACIHQTDTVLKAKEIGQQGKIFRQAAYGFIWASETSSKALTDIWTDLEALIDIGRTFDPSHMPILDRALCSARQLVFDPWFSSLWALQESQLRKAARVISADGRVIVANPLFVIVTFEGVYQTGDTAALSRIRALVEIVRQVGYSDQDHNPNTAFSAARHRKTSLSQDRIYAIMSLYGLKLRFNKLAYDPYAYPLEDLEYAFASALCESRPALSQYFTHTVEPKSGITWQLTHASRKVAGFTTGVGLVNNELRITATQSGAAKFTGHIFGLASAVALNCRLRFDIDEYLLAKHDNIKAAVDTEREATPWDQPDEGLVGSHSELAKTMLAEFSEQDLFLLRLRPPYGWERSLTDCPCVILRRVHASRPYFVRLGICYFWASSHGRGLEDGYHIDWIQVKGKLF
ncbi:hypothetical protein BDV96DRAFT_639297 [Lophiotrema nucula]|uniref:Heterokaryon incompatibility domain-containing protein n=1 Tax=Lophiotrema nucula TaxID=690887 RepID=A0A6A5ZWH7_9PLEO|nr:hypothetical protein BDV96DRAFT_639297 [Lophiotrema nucula]